MVKKSSIYFSSDKVAKWWKPTEITKKIRAWILSSSNWKGKRVLELGSGNGDMLRLMRDRGATVTGLDLCPAMIEQCNRLDVRLGDACNIPFPDNFFDVVVSIESFIHFDNQRKALKEIARVLKPRGICFIQTNELFSCHTLKKIPYDIINVLHYGSKLKHGNTVNGLERMFRDALLQPIKVEYFDGRRKFYIKGLAVKN